MKKRTQYTDDIEAYGNQNGIDVFREYKQASDERKEEIAQWMFQLIRSKNEIPEVQMSDEDVDRDLINLSETDARQVYQNGEFGFNTNGVSTCKKIFHKEMDNVERDGHFSLQKMFDSDYQLNRTIRKTLKYSNNDLSLRTWMILNGSGYSVTFRPASAKALYEIFGAKEDCRVLDTSAGYGARLMGAHFADNCNFYLAIDPNTANTCNNVLIPLLSERYNTNTEEKVLRMGSEDFTVNDFPEFKETFNISFTSPPYFKQEKYSDDPMQSWVKFPKYDMWVTGFYRSTIYNSCDMLRKDGVFSINIYEKIPNIKKFTQLFLADKGYYIYLNAKYKLRTMPGNTHRVDEDGNPILNDTSRDSYEPIWFAKHYTQLNHEGLMSNEQYQDAKGREVR